MARCLRSGTSAGFTLVELVVVMILIGILAVVVLPRFADRQTFNTRGFADEARSALQFARKVAVATGRNVCAAAGGATLTLTMATNRGHASACNQAVVNPATGGNYSIVAQGGLTLSALGVVFRGDGSASADASLTVTGDSSITINITAATGYVH